MDKYYTLKEAHDILKVSIGTLRRHIREGKLKAYKVAYWRISEKDFKDYIERTKSQSYVENK